MIIDNFPVFKEKLAYQILSVLQDIFMDIRDIDLLYLKNTDLDSVDFYFADVLEQCSDSEESD